MTDRKTSGFWFAVAATVLVVTALVAGVVVVGGPGEARLERLDEARRNDLQEIERTLRNRWRSGQPTPATLADLTPGASPEFDSVVVPDPSAGHLHDPVTGEPYAYRALSDSRAEVCATFALPYSRPSPYLNGSTITAHPAGRACFTLTPND
jgi:hypothetical protein